jgi:hypothetical protein
MPMKANQPGQVRVNLIRHYEASFVIPGGEVLASPAMGRLP